MYFLLIPFLIESRPIAATSVTFQVDMQVQIALGQFEPISGVMAVIGTFNDWNASRSPMTNSPAQPTVFVGTLDIDLSPGTSLDYKYVMNSTTSESRQTRSFILADSSQTLPCVFFNDQSHLGELRIKKQEGSINLSWTPHPNTWLQGSSDPVSSWRGISDTLGRGSTILTPDVSPRFFRLTSQTLPGNWVYQLSNNSQTGMVNLDVLVLDLNNRPVAQADMLAYCEPWDFVQRGKTGNSGRWTTTGPIGVWTFYAGSEFRTSHNVLAVLRRRRVDQDTSIEVRPDRRMQFTLTDAHPSPFNVRLIPTDLPSPVGWIPCGSITPNTKAEWEVSASITGIATLLQEPQVTSPVSLHFIPFQTAPWAPPPTTARPLGRIRFTIDSSLTKPSWWNFQFDPLDHEAGIQWTVKPTVPRGKSNYNIDVTPGRYRIWTDFYDASSLQLGAVFAPHVVTVMAGQMLDLAFSTRLRVQGAEVLAWNWMVHLWFDLVDENGNYVDWLAGEARLRLQQAGVVAYDGPITSSSARYIGLQDPLSTMRDGRPIDVLYTYNSPLVGIMNYSGELPQDRVFNESLPILATTEHFRFFARDPSALAEDTLHSMELAYSWLAENYAGPVHPSSRSRFDLGLWSPVFLAGSTGDAIGIDVYSAGKLVPNTCPEHYMALFHEFGHYYQGSPPHHQADGMGSNVCESQAGLIEAFCLRALHGDRVFRQHRQGCSTEFFKFLSGTAGRPADANCHLFILFYIDARYGSQVHYDFFRAVYADEGNCGRLLLTMDFLSNEHQKIAALYSFLVGENLGWLYRWAGLPVSDTVVERAVRRFQELKAELPPRRGSPTKR